MNPVSSTDIVLNLIAKVKRQNTGYFTNFFLDLKKLELWIKLYLIEYEEINETVFLFRKNQDFTNLSFITSNLTSFSEDLHLLNSKFSYKLFVVDLVGTSGHLSKLKTIFLENGFYQYVNLVRMSRIINDQSFEDVKSNHLFSADKVKGGEIYYLLQKHFDPYAEQLPLIEEITDWTDTNQIIIYSDDNKQIQGFVIFEFTGQTSYLRYWFVHPAHREKKIGSALLRSFFAAGKNAKRQLFWVIESNDNAIKRYEHYGFKKEELFDIILINNNIRYGGESIKNIGRSPSRI